MSDTQTPASTQAPETYEQMLDRWLDMTRQMSTLKTDEKALREKLFAAAFPKPKVGSNRLTLADGRVVQGNYKLYSNVDQAMVYAVMDRLRTEHEVVAESVFTPKFSVSATGLKALPAEALALAESCIITKPGAPSLAVT